MFPKNRLGWDGTSFSLFYVVCFVYSLVVLLTFLKFLWRYILIFIFKFILCTSVLYLLCLYWKKKFKRNLRFTHFFFFFSQNFQREWYFFEWLLKLSSNNFFSIKNSVTMVLIDPYKLLHVVFNFFLSILLHILRIIRSFELGESKRNNTFLENYFWIN